MNVNRRCGAWLMATALGAAAVPFAWADAHSAPPTHEPAVPGSAPGPGGLHGHRGHQGLHGLQGPHAPRGHRGAMVGREAGPAMMLLGPGLDRALDVANATPAQRADIRRIAGTARDDLLAARRQGSRPASDAWMAAWVADQLDTAEMDRQRQQEVARGEARSRRLMQAVVDIGQVLRPEQRRALAEHWRAQRGAYRGAHHRAEHPLIGHHAERPAD